MLCDAAWKTKKMSSLCVDFIKTEVTVFKDLRCPKKASDLVTLPSMLIKRGISIHDLLLDHVAMVDVLQLRPNDMPDSPGWTDEMATFKKS